MQIHPRRPSLETVPQRSTRRSAFALTPGLLTAVLIASVHAQSYPVQYVSTVWQTEQGLPQNSVNAILQDHQGYLWIGTFGGLARFDGVRFALFDSANTPGFSSGQILSLNESRSGTLWIGTVSGGLIRMDHGVAKTYTEGDGLPSGFIRSIREDAGGKLWVNTARGIARFAGEKLEAYPTHRGIAVSEFYLQARDGSMWFRSAQGVLRFGADGSMQSLKVNSGGILVQETHDGSVWVAFRNEQRLVRYSDGAFSDVPLGPIGRPILTGDYPSFTITMTEDPDGDLLLLTPAGLVRIKEGKPGPPEALTLPSDGYELPKIRTLLADREGNLWVGMIGAGLVRLRRAPLAAYGKEEGLSDTSFRAVFRDREGRMWFGGDLLYWFDGLRFRLFPGIRNILAIAQTRDGTLWFGGYGGLYRWQPGDLTHFDIDAPAVKAIYQDRGGTLWIGAKTEERPGGLYRFLDGKLEKVPGISSVDHIMGEQDGSLWVVGIEGLFRMRSGKTVRYTRSDGLPDHSMDLCRDSTGSLWIASYGGGLARFRDGRFQAITARDGLPNNMLVGIVDDGRGSLWVSSLQNIFRLSLKELNDFADGRISSILAVSYGVAEGMRSSEGNSGSPSGWQTPDGRIWFPNLRGVVAIDPSVGNRLPPSVVLEDGRANQVTLALGGRSSVPPGNGTFDFRFTALSFSAPEKLYFKYRLEPFDRNWIDAGAARTAHYTNMAPGEYSFHVIAANSFGVWNHQGSGVTFVLRPHFYQTKSFYALCAAFFLALVWSAYLLRVRQLQHEFNVRLNERVEERTRIARELHDTLLQSFQGSLYRFQAARNLFGRRPEEALKTLESAIASAENAVAEGRDAIQNLRVESSQGRLEDLLTATGQELRDAQEGSDHQAVFGVSVEGQPRSLSPVLQDDLYRIAREVIRNAFRHAEARQIEAAIQYDPDLFRLRIRDDGKGIDPKVLQEGARAGHWGLPGIRERAKRIGARLELWSENGAGTEVELTVPARIAYGMGHSREGFPWLRRSNVKT